MASGGYLDQGTKQQGKSIQTSAKGVAYWGDAPEAYDTVVLGGVALPGLCAIKGKGYEMKAKHNKAAGTNGESIVHLGREPATWTIHVLMTVEAHLRAFEALIPVIKPPYKPPPKQLPQQQYVEPGAGIVLSGPGVSQGGALVAFEPTALNAPKPGFATSAPKDKSPPSFLTIQHPLLALFRISHCIVTEVTMPEQVQEKGMWESRINCREYVLSGSKKASTTKVEQGVDVGRTTGFDDKLKRGAAAPSQTNAGPPTVNGTGSY